MYYLSKNGIQDLILLFPEGNPYELPYCLSKNGIQDLILLLPEGNPYELPSSLFTCLQIKCLFLKRRIVRPLLAFRGFNKLVTLNLCKATTTSKLLESFITHSPSLENLDILSVILDHIQVNALTLKKYG